LPLITEDVIRLIIKQQNMVLVGTVNSQGIPNISPRYVLGILDNDRLLFADGFENKTFHNIKSWPKISVAVLDSDTHGGYQLKGSVQEVADPKLVSNAAVKLRGFGIDVTPVKVWTLKVEEVYSLEPSAKSKQPLASAYL